MSNHYLNYRNTIDQFASKKILVIGDFILDVYVKGVSTRLSPEAPVPVVDVAEKLKLLGGAANTAYNLKALSADVTFCTMLGADAAADEAIKLMEACEIIVSNILHDDERTTLVKTRVVAGDRVLVRYDEGTDNPIDATAEQNIINLLQKEYYKYDAIIISDYDKGLITEKVVNHLVHLQETHHKFLVVDSKRLPFFSALKPDLIKPNYDEVRKLLNVPPQYTSRSNQIQRDGGALYAKTKSKFAAVTLDSEGSIIFHEDQVVYKAFAPAIAAPNVSGAGDTYISAFTLALICSNDVPTAAELATAAASIAVSKSETAACFAKELGCYFSLQQKCILSATSLEAVCQSYHAQGKRIVFTNGCFDILHSGHVSYLNQARALGDILIVGLNNDESIKRLKGEKRPINPLQDRVEVLAGLTSVTHIIPFGDERDDTPIKLIKAVKPSIFVKGGDYTRDKLPEADTIDEVGGTIIFIPLVPDHSTTRIIDRIHAPSIFSEPELI